jgi:hypothetical protein
LSLDEAYLDVTENLKGISSATQIAEEIRARIRAETELAASAGVSYNKFLAKLASDHRKPDGLFVSRREADFIFNRMRRVLAEFGTDFAHSVRLDQYYPNPRAVAAYHLARHDAFGDYIPPSTSWSAASAAGRQYRRR